MLRLISVRKSTCRKIEGLMAAGCHGAASQLVVQSSCTWGLAAPCPALPAGMWDWGKMLPLGTLWGLWCVPLSEIKMEIASVPF